MISIQRKLELFLVTKLAAAVSGHSFYPYHGGTAFANMTEIEPPFSVVAVVDAEKTMQQEGTWLCTGTLQILAHAAETNSQAHAALSGQIYGALDEIAAEIQDAGFSFHGLDITGMSSSTDSESACYADIIKFVAGVGG